MKLLLPLVLASSALLAQAPAGKLEFEVASVRPAAPASGENQVNLGLHLNGSQARFTSVNLKSLVAMAYSMGVYQVTAPDWAGSDRIDLNAKLPEGSTSDQIPQMLQALLVDRFQLKFHKDKKELPVYALTMGKLPLKFKAVEGAEEDGPPSTNIAVSGSSAGVSVDLGHGTTYTFANNKFDAIKFSMNDLASVLEHYMDRPVVNQTGIKGRYDFVLDLTEEDYQAMLVRLGMNAGLTINPKAVSFSEGHTPVSLMDALQKAGLKLETRKAPLEVLVIDQLRKTPTDN